MPIVARVVRVLLMPTGIALQLVPAKDRSPAINNVGNDFGPDFRNYFKPWLELPKYIGDLKSWSQSQSHLWVSFVHWV